MSISFKFVNEVRQKAYDNVKPCIVESLKDLGFGTSQIEQIAKSLADGQTYLSFIDEDGEVEINYDLNQYFLVIDFEENEDDVVIIKLHEEVGQILKFAYSLKIDSLNSMLSKTEEGHEPGSDDNYPIVDNNVIMLPVKR